MRYVQVIVVVDDDDELTDQQLLMGVEATLSGASLSGTHSEASAVIDHVEEMQIQS